MKKILVLTLSLFLAACANHPRYNVIPPDQRGYKHIVEVPGLSKEELHQRAKEWVAITYVSGNDVVQDQNANTGRLIGRGVTSVAIDSGGLMDVVMRSYYSVVVDVKDGKARLQLGDYRWVQHGTSPTMALYINPLNKKMKEVSDSFDSFMRTGNGASMSSNDDW